MTLKDKINADFMEAYKAKDMKKKDFLGVLKGAIQTQEGKQIISTDDNVRKIIKSIEKGVNETLEGNKKLNLDVSEQEAELGFLKPYLPQLMDEIKIREEVRLIIIESANKNIGYLMGMFTKKFSGLADMNLVKKVLTEELA